MSGLLEEEFSAAVCNLPPATIHWLRRFRIPDSVIFGKPLMLGVAKVQTFPSGFYEPNDDGANAVIIAEGWPELPIWDVIEDLVAFKPQNPGHWWRRRGEVQLLGAYNIRPEPVFPLAVHETPLSWLQAGVQGVCIVDWSFDPERLLYAGPLEVETPFLKSRLERRIQQAAVEKFQITVTGGVRDAA
jgi:hypothetical protein